MTTLVGGAEAIANEIATLEQEVVRLDSTVHALRAATRVTESVASAFQKERILRAVSEALTRTYGAAIARVWLVGPGDRCGTCHLRDQCANRASCLHLVEGNEPGPIDLALKRVPIGEHSVGRVAAVSGTVVTNDLAADPALADPDWARIERLRAFAGHPLVHEGRLLGVVAMWSREPIREEVTEALRVLARHAATAIAGAQLISDVREQSARSQAATRKLEALVDASRSGVVMFDHDGAVAYVNEPFRQLFGLTGRTLIGLMRPDLEALLAPLVVRGRKTRLLDHEEDAEDLELVVALPDRERVLQRYTSPVSGPNGQLGWVAVFDDVTQAHEADRVKSEFISTISHELRTPLTSMKGALSLILDGLDLAAPFDDDTVELLRVSQRNAERLIRLVNDILDVSKIEAGKLDLRVKPVSTRKLCTEAAAGVDGFARKVAVGIRLDLALAPPLALADADRVVQVLTNLLSNALKFSPRGGEVLLQARPSDGEVAGAPGVVFRVVDRGPGIPADFKAKLFTKFAQADRARREQEGTGLGLAICRALVQGHGGDIWAEGQPGEGATFCFTLPTVAP